MSENNIIVRVYEQTPKNFTKYGRLSKRAKPVIHDTHCEVLGDDGMAYTIRQRLPRIVSVESPYVFTHIILRTVDGKTYLVFQDVEIGGRELITSPSALLEELKKTI